jgi:pimeloyl-ACP methyl ester carboxylesterase
MYLPRPTIVLIPGAWHKPSTFDFLLPYLHKAGYPTSTISLPSVGISPGLPNFDADVQEVRTVVAALVEELNRDVVIVAHSYGAVPATESLKGLGLSKKERGEKELKGGVTGLVYLAACVPAEGQHTMDSVQPARPPEEGGAVSVMVDNGVSTLYLSEDWAI